MIIDVGYGVSGSRVFNLLEGFADSELKVLAVLNVSRPMTANLEDIVEYLQAFEQLDGLVNNTHLGDETELATICHGVEIGAAVAEALGIPVIATAADERFRRQLGRVDQRGNPIRYLKRYMEKAYW